MKCSHQQKQKKTDKYKGIEEISLYLIRQRLLRNDGCQK